MHATDFPVGREHRHSTDGAAAARVDNPFAAVRPETDDVGIASSNRQRKHHGADAPACDSCGHITIRNGTCYKCVNCGSSMGCS